MADLGSAVRSYLIADAAVAQLVGARIYPDALPQGYRMNTGGALTYSIISTAHDHLINGLAGIARSRLEFTAVASGRAAANEIAEAVRASGLVGFTGDLHGVEIEGVMLDSGVQSLTESPTDGSQDRWYLTVFDYLIAYQETV